MKGVFKPRWVNAVGVGLLVLGTAGACRHTRQPALDTASKETVNATRGLCPTDLNQAQMIVRDGGDKIGVIFRSDDPSTMEKLSERAAEIGEALANVHPAVNQSGKLVQHAPMPKPELEQLSNGSGTYGVELVFRPKPEEKAAVLADLNDHETMWRRGECPDMADESVKPNETAGWERTDR
ncbi:MAG TPA: hypothetical protein VGF45_16060 [Polyangia bacterium]